MTLSMELQEKNDCFSVKTPAEHPQTENQPETILILALAPMRVAPALTMPRAVSKS